MAEHPKQALSAGSRLKLACLFLLVLATCALFTLPAWEMLLVRLGASDESMSIDGRWYRPVSANDFGNLATIQMLVEHGTWAIDRSRIKTSDWALVEGRHYSVRPPVLPFLASAVHGILYNGFGWSLAGKVEIFGLCHYVLVLCFSGLTTALTAVFIVRSVALAQAARAFAPQTDAQKLTPPEDRHSRISATAWLAGGLFAWGSLALPYAVVLNHHTPAGFLIAVATFVLLRAQINGVLLPWQAALAGLCAGLAATIDVAGGGIFLLGVAGWVLTVPALRRTSAWGIAAVLSAGLLHTILNWQITGDPIPLLVRPEYIDVPGSTLGSHQLSGFLNHESPVGFLVYSLRMLIGPDTGLLIYLPSAFFAAVAVFRLLRRPSHPLRWAAVYLGGATIAYVGYLALFTNNYAGGCYGVRWYVLLVPTLHLLLFGGWELFSPGERVCALLAQAAAIPLAWTGLVVGAWQPTRLFYLAPHYVWLMPALFLAALLWGVVERRKRSGAR